MLTQLAKLAAHQTGAVHLVQRLHRSRLRILMYHRFPARDQENFDAQCSFLASRYTVVSLTEAVHRLSQGRSLANLAVITIDDGYADMHEVAFPILRRHNLPATLFVTTGFLNRTCWMPGDRVRHHFAHTTGEAITVTDHQGATHRFRTGDPAASEALRELLKRVPNHTRSRILASLEAPDDVPDPYRPCTWDQLREMAGAGISIGAHTVTHPILSRLETPEAVDAEILDSRACIEQQLGRPVDSFAYPNGMPQDIHPASVRCARSHFTCAVTAIHGLNAPGADPHQLLRLPANPDLPIPELARMLAGPLRPTSVPAPIG